MTVSHRLRTEFGDADDSTGLMLWRVTNTWQAAQRRVLKPFGITHVQFVLLASLTWLDGDAPVTQQALARHAGTDPMMTSQVLRALESAGLIDRGAHPSDGRAKLLRVTAAGRELANRAIGAVEACDRAFFDTLDGDRADFTRMLSRLARSS
ncbi:MAG TPA: MarR family transcriptional regulator [Mycobacteriales bacterium]|jgi:DNA-binding MarR family transcriptional regulator|nr:MarR family transcriptional regulator [Mycobacteriales bacterium]